MKSALFIFIGLLILTLASGARAASADSMSTIVDLETKITQKMKGIVAPIDPDVIISTNVSIKKTNADLVGTQMQAVGIFATSSTQKIEDEDIESVNVKVISNLDPFPAELSKIMDTAVLAISKKGKVSISKMEATTFAVIEKRSEVAVKQAKQIDRITQLIEEVYSKTPPAIEQLLKMAGGFQLGVLLIQAFIFLLALRSLGKKIASIRLQAPEISQAAPIAAPQPEARQDDARAFGSGSITTAESPFKDMPTPCLRSIFADAYWCEKDEYAAWVWTQLTGEAKIKLLDSWTALGPYAKFLSQTKPVENSYHLDACYLKPDSSFMLSNSDLMADVKKNKWQWHQLSLLRKQSIDIDLRERLELMQSPELAETPKWSSKPSRIRVLETKLEVSTLSGRDEEMLFENPTMLSNQQKRQFPSLVWVALLPRESRDRVLTSIPAQALAEVWAGPEGALQAIRESLPQKKRELLDDYVKSLGRVNKNSTWLPTISKTALDAFDEIEQMRSQPPELKAA